MTLTRALPILVLFSVACQGELMTEINNPQDASTQTPSGPNDASKDTTDPPKSDASGDMNPSDEKDMEEDLPNKEDMDPPGPMCGDGKVDQGESCDGNCPSSCDDNNVCTSDKLNGSADRCNAMCSHQDITQCVDGDGCCPSNCDQTNDSDCNAMCGNDVVEAGESCDGDCPSSCDDSNACTMDSTQGSAQMCDMVCKNDPVTACTDGDGCCPSNCDHTNDSDCEVACTDHAGWPMNWSAEEAIMIMLVNMERMQGANCGRYGDFPAVGPVSMNKELQVAARCHSVDMTTNMFFDHTGSDNSNFSARASRAGYSGFARGENIAAGNQGAAATLSQWMGSDGHCRNIMQPDIDRMGIGYDYDRNVQYRHYWTMVTGRGGPAL